jgi:hypothetical protein
MKNIHGNIRMMGSYMEMKLSTERIFMHTIYRP